MEVYATLVEAPITRSVGWSTQSRILASWTIRCSSNLPGTTAAPRSGTSMAVRRVGSAEQCARRHPVPAVPARRVRRPGVLPDYLDSFGSSSRMTGGRCRIPLVERWPFALVRGRRTPQAILAGVFFPATWMAWYVSDQLRSGARQEAPPLTRALSADGERAPPMSQRIQRRPRHHFSPGSSDCDHFARANTARVSSGAVRWPAMSSGQPSTSAAAHSAHCATSA
jgi:hypothetical protein